MTATLKQRALRSGSWVILGHISAQVLRLGGNLILTRLLVPEMFGVMAIVTVIMVGLALFSDVGLLQNIVQSKRGEEPDYLNTAWTIQIIRGFLIFLSTLAIAVAAYYAAQFGYLSEQTVYGAPELPIILAVVSVSALISGFDSIHMLLLNRKLMLGKLAFIGLVSQIVGLVFMLIWAWFQRDIWALVFGGLVAAITKMILSHSLKLGSRCCFFWDKQSVKEIFHFGKWIFIASILGFLLNQGDRLILGGLISPEELGVYAIAFFLANALKDVVSKLISSVFFPVLSEVVRNEPERLEKIYYTIRHKIDALIFFVAGFIFAAGETIVDFLYDDRYIEAGWMLQGLAVSLISAGSLLADQCFLAHGMSKKVTGVIFVQTISFYVALPLLFFKFGMEGAIGGIVLISFVRMLVSGVYMRAYFFYNIKKEFLMLPVAFIAYFIGGLL